MIRMILCCLFLYATQVFCIDQFIDYNDFYALMGKETSHWKFVNQSKDIAFLEEIESLYQQNKEFQFEKTGNVKIPKIIHLIWLGPKTFPAKSVENLRSWIAYHPNWKVKFWTDRDREPPCSGIEMVDVSQFSFAFLEKCYHDSKNWAEKSDLLRYEILLAEGGVYVDHDAACLASFNGLIEGYDFFCCLEVPHEPFAGSNITCWNGVIGSRPQHPAMQRVVELVADCWEKVGQQYRGKDLYSQVEVVMQRTYITFTEAMKGTLNKQGNRDIIFPAAYFFAKSNLPSIYSKHFCLTLWDDYKFRKTDFEKFNEKSLHKIHRKTHLSIYVAAGSLLFSALVLLFSIQFIRRRGNFR